MVAVKKINEMRRIEGEYFGVKDTNFNVEIKEDIVVVPRGVLEQEPADSVPRPIVRPQTIRPAPAILDRTPSRMPTGIGFRMTPGGLRLR